LGEPRRKGLEDVNLSVTPSAWNAAGAAQEGAG
jgi:hypothetical protein